MKASCSTPITVYNRKVQCSTTGPLHKNNAAWSILIRAFWTSSYFGGPQLEIHLPDGELHAVKWMRIPTVSCHKWWSYQLTPGIHRCNRDSWHHRCTGWGVGKVHGWRQDCSALTDGNCHCATGACGLATSDPKRNYTHCISLSTLFYFDLFYAKISQIFLFLFFVYLQR